AAPIEASGVTSVQLPVMSSAFGLMKMWGVSVSAWCEQATTSLWSDERTMTEGDEWLSMPASNAPGSNAAASTWVVVTPVAWTYLPTSMSPFEPLVHAK